MKDNKKWKALLLERLLKFSISIVSLVNKLPKSAAGFAISSQLIRSGTSVGANTEEAQDASSLKDFIQKLSIALREARETLYWLKVIKGAKLVSNSEIEFLLKESEEITSILVTSIKSARKKLT